MRIGVYGGTFDPPHLAHLVLAAEACSQLHLGRMLWVLTPQPPHKPGQPISPTEVRLVLLQAAIADNPDFEVSRVELDRPGPHYAVDTVRLLAEQNPADEIVYLIGGDSLHDLPTWHTPDELVQVTDYFGVMRRPGDEVNLEVLEQRFPGLQDKLLWVKAPLLEIAGRDIRARVKSGRPYRYFLPYGVYRLIQDLGLYR